MQPRKSLILGVLFAALSASSLAATLQQTDRITGAITNSPSVVLKGDVHPKARPQYDQGPVEPGMKLGYITMVLQATAAQQADLKQFLQDLQNPQSPSYHKWLTSAQYADRFGVSQHDMQKMQDWLTAQGFEIVQPAHGRNWIAFSGTAELVSQVFQTQIHYYMVDGEKHFSNATNPSIPKSLSGMVMGFRGMNNFTPKPMYVARGQNGKANPFYSSGGFNNLAPADIATIYDIQALYNAGITGSGQKIAVMGQTDIDTTDIAAFRSGFGLSPTLPTTVLVSTDPGTTGDLGEADLDLEWSGAVAQDASIIYVIGNPVTGNGVFDAVQYAIDNDTAPVISLSYGGCEAANVTFIPFFEPILKTASTKGITILASSGDSGAAGCDADTQSSATQGLAVNYPASSPEVTGVGGNEFDESAGTGPFWGSNGSNLGSALSYIPEIGWNDTSINGSLAASGGGKSSCGVESAGACTAGFPKPSWQVATGVPADNVRDVPDISMAASADHDGYIFCSSGSCASGIANAVASSSIVGGTSASAPVFAGVVVLLNDYLVTNGVQSTPGLGNINSKLYKLYATSTNAFHDVITGNNIVPCTSGTTGCPASAPFQYGYSAGVGYDQVTGLGSVDANELAVAFAGFADTTTLTLTPPPTNGIYVSSSQSVALTATVTASAGTAVPTGTVIFEDNGTALPGSSTVTLVSGSASFPATLNGGNHSLTAVYSGDSNFPASTSASTAFLVTLDNPNTTSLQLSASSVSQGSPVTFTATITPGSGTTTPTGTVSFANAGVPLGSGTLSGGVATFTTSTLAGGTYTVSANYSGDATYAITSSSASTLNVQDFSLSQPTILISAPGQSGTGTITATALGGFSGTIAYTCTGAPSEATCTVTATATGATVSVTTTAASSSQLSRPGASGGMFYAMLLPGMLGILIVGRRKALKGGVQVLSLVVILGLSTLWMSACGGSSGGGGTPNPGTPTGTTSLTVTGTSGTLTRNSTVTLTIQ